MADIFQSLECNYNEKNMMKIYIEKKYPDVNYPFHHKGRIFFFQNSPEENISRIRIQYIFHIVKKHKLFFNNILNINLILVTR